MASGDGFNEQTFVDAVEAANSVWSTRAVTFLDRLAAIAEARVSFDLPSTLMPVLTSTRDDEMAAELRARPTKPGGLSFDAPSDPGDAPDITVPDVETVAVPAFDGVRPEVDIPSAPELETLEAPTAPTLRSVAVPAPPDVELPAAPTITAVSFPDAQEVQLPEFARTFPAEPDLLLQTTRFEWSEGEVSNTLLDEVESKLTADLRDGGYGIDPDDEEALWARARDRERSSVRDAEEQALREEAARGFTVPSGAAMARVDAARREGRERLSEMNREISTKRADLFRDTRRHALEQGAVVSDMRLKHEGFRLERALNAARFTAEFAVSVAEAETRIYNAKVAAYQAYVEAFGARVRAAVAQVELFRTQVQAAVEQQRAKQVEVDLYAAVVAAATSRVQLYEAQVRGVATEVDVERARMEAFRAEVQGYVARVQGQQNLMQLFEARVRGELGKAQVFATEASAFESRVRAAQVENSVRNRDVELGIERGRLDLGAYETSVRAYAARTQAEDSRVRALLAEYATDSDVYRAAMTAWEALGRLSIAEIQSVTDTVRERIRLEQINESLALRALADQQQSAFSAANAGARISGDLLTAYNSAINAISGTLTDGS